MAVEAGRTIGDTCGGVAGYKTPRGPRNLGDQGAFRPLAEA